MNEVKSDLELCELSIDKEYDEVEAGDSDIVIETWLSEAVKEGVRNINEIDAEERKAIERKERK